MKDTKEQIKLNPSGFLDSVCEVEIKVIDVTKMIPQNPPSVSGDKVV